ncbi:MAG: hypothetical protein H8K10_14805 [Nitrospira sp.]|nr:hypothetical protein [Nitrospira sp.]
MFANNSGLIIPYTEVIAVLAQLTSCRDIGLKIRVGAFEYPLWQIARHSGMNVVFRHAAIDNEFVKTVGNAAQEPPCALIVLGDERIVGSGFIRVGAEAATCCGRAHGVNLKEALCFV